MNKKLYLLLALLGFPMASIMGQPRSNRFTNPDQPRLLVSASVVPTLSHTNYQARYLYPESDGQVVEPVFLNGIRWASGYSVGVSVLYEYAPGWSVSSGLWWQQLTIRQQRQPQAGEGTIYLHSRAIRVPLLLNYASSMKRLSPYFSFGLLTDFPIMSRVVVTQAGESTQRLRLFPLISRPYFHGLLGAGARYRITKRYTVMAQPVWSYNFGQLGGASTNDSSFELSMQMQLAYTF